MFTIDLLEGQGRPVRTRPKGVAIFAATFIVPMLAAILLVGLYYRNKIMVTIHNQNIANYATQIERLADALKLKEGWEKDKTSLNSCLADVASSIGRHTQWSSILVAIVENLPESVILNGLEVKQSSIRRKAAAKADAAKDKEKKDKKTDTNVIVRTLRMRVSGSPDADMDREVKVFRDRLRASSVIGTKLEDIVIASQGNDTLDGREVIAYDIDCIFKSGI